MTNNYFVVPRHRLNISRAAEVESDEVDAIARKAARITSRKPLTIDWAAYHFFDDNDPISTLRAYEKARGMSANVAVFKAVGIAGPWSAARIVGQTTGPN